MSGHDIGDLPEVWLRGPLAQVHPVLAAALYGFQQAREDLARHTTRSGRARTDWRRWAFISGTLPEAWIA